MKDDGTFDALWILKRCVWCNGNILPENLSHTTDRETGNVYFEHKVCPED